MKKLLLFALLFIPAIIFAQKPIYSPGFTELKTASDTLLRIHDDDGDSIRLATQFYVNSKISNDAYSLLWQPNDSTGASKQALFNKISTMEAIDYCPDTLIVNTGTLDQGDASDLCAVGGTDVVISEASGANPLRVTFEFSGVTRMNYFVFFGDYDGGASHVLWVEAYNWTTLAWDYLGLFGNSNVKQWYSFPIFTPNTYISSGAVQIRISHQGTGIISHQLVLDYVDINFGGAGGGTSIEASTVGFTPTGGVSSTNVQAAIQELDTEKQNAANAVTAISAFSADNRIIRSDGTGRGVQYSGITIDDSDNVSAASSTFNVSVLSAGSKVQAQNATEASGKFSYIGSATNTVSPLLDLYTTSSGSATNGIGGSIVFYTQRAGGSAVQSSNISNVLTNVTAGAETSKLSLWTRYNGSNLAENFIFDGQGNQTNVGSITLNTLTASELVATDANKKLQSLAVATYPSLTEISYIKGLTGAAQNQINSKKAEADSTDTDGYTRRDRLASELAKKENTLTKGALTEAVDGLVFSDSTRQVIGGATALSLKAGRVIPTATNISHAETAYTDRLKWDGGSTGLVAATGRTSLGLVIGTDVLAYRTFGTAANSATTDFEVPLTFSTGLNRTGNTITNTITQFTTSDEIDPKYAADSAYVKIGIRNWYGSLAYDIDAIDTTKWGYGYTAYNWGNWATGLTKTFVDNLHIDADSLGNHPASYYAPASGSANYVQISPASAQSGGFWIDGNAKASTLQSTIATGTAPLTVASTTLVSNLNADLLDGKHASDFQLALTNPITGTGATGQVAFWNGTNTQGGDNGLFWDNTNKYLGIGTTGPGAKLDVTDGDIYISGADAVSRQIRFREAGVEKFSITHVGSDESARFYLANGGNVMTLKAGNVGIGTTDGIDSKLTFAEATTAAGGILFGSDVNLYRSAANILKTDDTFEASVLKMTTGAASGYLPVSSADGTFTLTAPSTVLADYATETFVNDTLASYYLASNPSNYITASSLQWTAKSSDVYRNSKIGIGDFTSATIDASFHVLGGQSIFSNLNTGGNPIKIIGNADGSYLIDIRDGSNNQLAFWNGYGSIYTQGDIITTKGLKLGGYSGTPGAGSIHYSGGLEVHNGTSWVPVGLGTVTSVSSSTTNQLTVANGTTTPALSIVTATVVDGGTALATGDQINDFVRAGFTTLGDISVPYEAYGVGWDSNTEVPTKAAVYAKIQTISGGSPGGSSGSIQVNDGSGGFAGYHNLTSSLMTISGDVLAQSSTGGEFYTKDTDQGGASDQWIFGNAGADGYIGYSGTGGFIKLAELKTTGINMVGDLHITDDFITDNGVDNYFEIRNVGEGITSIYTGDSSPGELTVDFNYNIPTIQFYHKVGVTGISKSIGLAQNGSNTMNLTTHTYIIEVGSTSATITLPSSTIHEGQEYRIVNQTNGARTISTYKDFAGSDATTISANSSITVQMYNSAWYRVQ